MLHAGAGDHDPGEGRRARTGHHASEHGKIEQLLDEAEGLLAAGDPLAHPELAEVIHPGYYAFVCESCAPTFDYYGYFLAAKRFADRAKEITEQLS